MKWGMIPRRLASGLLDRLPADSRARLLAMHYARLLRHMTQGEEPDVIVARAVIEPGSTAVDVGANIGVYTCWFSEFVGENGRVIALEPLPGTCAILRRVSRRLGCSNVVVVDAAASDRSGILWMQVPVDDRGIRSHYLAHIGDRTEDAFAVRAVTIDELVGSTSITLIKVDVEGHELPCLRGSLETLRRSRPALLVEINRDCWDRESSDESVVELLRGGGYGVWWFDGTRLRPWNGAVCGVNYWFLRPSHIAAIQSRAPELVDADGTHSGS